MEKLTDAEYQKQAEDMVAKTKEAMRQSFLYGGDLPLGETWAWTAGRSRDSDLLNQSNFAVILEDMKQFRKDVKVERYGHWGPGWVERLCVRMLDKDGKVTKAGRAAVDWEKRLEDYPVADDEDWSDRQDEAMDKNLKAAVEDLLRGSGWELKSRLPGDWEWNLQQATLVELEDDWPLFVNKEEALKVLIDLGVVEKLEE